MAQFGLIGKNIDYSFSRAHFGEKFKALGLDHTYENVDLQSAEELAQFIKQPVPFKGLNVTIPFKTAVIPYLDELDPVAEAIGAVNTIKITESGRKIGYNTDHFGFQKALEPFLPLKDRSALILGTGGAAAAIVHTLANLDFRIQFVSREASDAALSYEQVSRYVILDHLLIVNCTPLGTHPNTDRSPEIPYEFITENHLLFDLVYNPEVTTFMKKGARLGATTTNGYQMLVGQAEKAWEIWNS
ncbi:shikimate dehydrogenase family protein [Gilvibacter sediminis]|uniref:shikimate dehydrogenase family protein n=1 Tax=Gilvibacter sediminis TaxID=379071 RepID=UPI002350709D|nr:shikimate dehydrogenase [Gilvibacter sediminis]MDC7998881.1 shikimate dehydrogenase [Gilvibacter sediminis]